MPAVKSAAGQAVRLEDGRTDRCVTLCAMDSDGVKSEYAEKPNRYRDFFEIRRYRTDLNCRHRAITTSYTPRLASHILLTYILRAPHS